MENRLRAQDEIAVAEAGSSNLGMKRWGGLTRLATGDVSISFLDSDTHAFHIVNMPRAEFNMMLAAGAAMRGL